MDTSFSQETQEKYMLLAWEIEKKMYFPILMATSHHWYKKYPNQFNKMSEKNPPFPTRFTPVQTRFCDNHCGNSHDQTVSRANPAYEQNVWYQMHHTSTQGVSFQRDQRWIMHQLISRFTVPIFEAATYQNPLLGEWTRSSFIIAEKCWGQHFFKSKSIQIF